MLERAAVWKVIVVEPENSAMLLNCAVEPTRLISDTSWLTSDFLGDRGVGLRALGHRVRLGDEQVAPDPDRAGLGNQVTGEVCANRAESGPIDADARVEREVGGDHESGQALRLRLSLSPELGSFFFLLLSAID
jgi:hypothetical protein